MGSDCFEEEMYIYLDFNGRLPPDFFEEENLFFKAINLEQNRPVIQIGQCLFTGKYADCVGTNVFFEEDTEIEPSTNVFEKNTPIKLNFFTKQFKTLNLEWAKIPEDAELPIDPKELYDLKIKDTYDVLLDKLEKHTLNIEEVAVCNNDKENKIDCATTEENILQPVLPSALVQQFGDKIEKNRTENIGPCVKSATDVQLSIDSTNKDYTDQLKVMEGALGTLSDRILGKEQLVLRAKNLKKHDILEMMCREPLSRTNLEPPFEISQEFKLNYLYHNLRSKLLCATQFFPFIILEYDKDTLEGAVDINRCIRQGIIPPSEAVPRILTQKEKEAILKLENCENLSIPMRYCLLRKIMTEKKKIIQNASKKEMQQIDKFGVNMKDSYKVLKAVATDLKKYIFLNHQRAA